MFRLLKGPVSAADIAAMAIHGSALPPGPKPKAACPRCGRPVAVLKSGKCFYCGVEIPGSPPPAQSKVALPPDLLLAFAPRAASVSTGSQWIRRMIAFGATALLLAAIMGPCMKA